MCVIQQSKAVFCIGREMTQHDMGWCAVESAEDSLALLCELAHDASNDDYSTTSLQFVMDNAIESQCLPAMFAGIWIGSMTQESNMTAEAVRANMRHNARSDLTHAARTCMPAWETLTKRHSRTNSSFGRLQCGIAVQTHTITDRSMRDVGAAVCKRHSCAGTHWHEF